MLISKVVEGVNHALAGEKITKQEMLPLLDRVIDDINQRMNTIFPVFSDLESTATEYAYFPDRYIRTVVILGAAHYFYLKDEEGMVADTGFYMDYQNNLFYMLRDYLVQIPTAYKASSEQGTMRGTFTGVIPEGTVF